MLLRRRHAVVPLLPLLLVACGGPDDAPQAVAPPSGFSEALWAAAQGVLEEHPEHGVLVGQARILEEAASTSFGDVLGVVSVGLHLEPAGEPTPGTGPVPAEPGEMEAAAARTRRLETTVGPDGIFVLVAEPGAWRVVGHGVGILRSGDGQGPLHGKATRWTPPAALGVTAGEALRLPDLLFVPPVLVREPAADAHFPAASPPVLRWEPYPEADGYEVKVQRVERTAAGLFSTRAWADVRVDHPITDVNWEMVRARVPAYQRIGDTPDAGEYLWTVYALTRDGVQLSSGPGRAFHLDE